MLILLKKSINCWIRLCCQHKYLLIICLIVTTAYGMTALRDNTLSSSAGRGDYFAHGWPMAYVERLTETEPGNRWLIFSEIEKFNYIAFLFDLVVAIGLSFVVICLWHLHCIDGTPWRFTVKELLTAACVLCIIIIAYMKLRNDYINEEKYLAAMEKIGWSINVADTTIPWYLQPLKDLGIIEGDDWLIYGLEWSPELNQNAATHDINQILAEEVAQNQQLFFSRAVFLADPRLTDQGIKSLCKWMPYCTSLDIIDCPKITDRSIRYIIDYLPHLKSLNIKGVNMTNSTIQKIGREINERKINETNVEVK